MAEPRDYKKTLRLPETAFPMKANLAQREPVQLQRWADAKVYEQLLAHNAGKPRFVLHDGPPYANGNIHQGHMLNKVLKDIVVKAKSMDGHLCHFVPGWDCHGLPIELQVDKKLGSRKRELTKMQIRDACRAYATEWVDAQRSQFQRLGVFARWEKPYLTMSFDYEAAIVRELGAFAARGSLYRGKKPVHWCTHCRTALAEAEVEYAEHVSPTVYVGFQTKDLAAKRPALAGKRVDLVIWTTTPWTLPANLAVSAHPDFEYAAYELTPGRVIVVAKELLPAVLHDVAPDHLVVKDVKIAGADLSAATLTDPSRILTWFEGRELEHVRYAHPFLDRECVTILGTHVTLEQGSGLVHTAPGHGHEDYVVGNRYGLEVLNPVDDAGRFTDRAGEALQGKEIFAANAEIIQLLRQSGHLLHDGKLSHSYPHCWRCSHPVIFRATDQWFLSMETNDLRKRALEALKGVQWIPRWGEDRITGMLENRPDWCVSRQRSWGVPITVLYCEGCDAVAMEPEIFEKAAALVEQEGGNAWYAREAQEFLPAGYVCKGCGKGNFRKETDILDVWFDSGVSFAAVCEKDPTLGLPVDLYLEGSDQHRGWFHSSLLCSVGTHDASPYKACLTHGFVVDGEGKKISKKLGNYVDPNVLITRYGAEIMRLWVASEDYRDDIRTSEKIFGQLADSYFRIRNTLRYCLGNLGGFDPARDLVKPADLPPLDAWAYAKLQTCIAKVRKAYDDYEFHLVSKATVDFCAAELSAFYLDARKDLLYTGKVGGQPRRATQTVLYLVARELCRLLAPVLSFTAEEAFEHLPGEKVSAVFLAGLPTAWSEGAQADVAAGEALVERLLPARALALGRLEEARRDKKIGKALEARVVLRGAPGTLTKADEVLLAELLIVSQVELVPTEAPLAAEVELARGSKCVRCWSFSEQVGTHAEHPELCVKCTEAVEG